MACKALDRLNITIVVDNYYDAVRAAPAPADRLRATPQVSVYAEHGFSCCIEGVSNHNTEALLFDYGMSFPVLMNNLAVLGIDIPALQALALSHGHFDHWGGLIPFLEKYGADLRSNIPLYVGDDAFAYRFSQRPSAGIQDLGRLDRDAIESFGTIEILHINSPEEILPGVVLTGKIARTVPYENGSPTLLVMRGDSIEQDDFRGELAVVCNLRNKGIVVITGCAHAGIINTIRHAQQIMGIQKIHAVIGGFHLVNVNPEIIWQTIADMQEIAPDYVIPMHCTGFEAMTMFKEAMGDQFVVNTAGTRYSFGLA